MRFCLARELYPDEKWFIFSEETSAKGINAATIPS